MYEVARLKILSAQVGPGKSMATSTAFITFVQQQLDRLDGVGQV